MNFEIKIEGSGTTDQLAVRLIEIGRRLQVANVYGGEDELAGTTEDGCLVTVIKED
jgi:hypothetical protein